MTTDSIHPVTASDNEPYREAASDWAETQDRKAEVAKLRAARNPLFLTWHEADKIVQWKLGKDQQYGRNRQRWERNLKTPGAVEAITQAAFSIRSDDLESEARLRLGVLTALSGVGIPVASAFLAIAEPERYAVIDFRGWRQVVGTTARRTDFSLGHYVEYLAGVHRLSEELGWQPQEVDIAIWTYDIAMYGNRKVENA